MSIIEKFLTKMKQDGVDHIRIMPYAATQIGRISSQDWRKVFFVPQLGEFTSATCFANWISTGDEDARHDPKYRCNETIRGYRNFVLYAKFYQLCSMRSALEAHMKDLPFVAYKQHDSGIKEFDRWKEYPAEIKSMIQHIIDPERGPRTPYPFDPALLQQVNARIAMFVEAMKPLDPPPQAPREKKKPKKVNGQHETEASSVEATANDQVAQEQTAVQEEVAVSEPAVTQQETQGEVQQDAPQEAQVDTHDTPQSVE